MCLTLDTSAIYVKMSFISTGKVDVYISHNKFIVELLLLTFALKPHATQKRKGICPMSLS